MHTGLNIILLIVIAAMVAMFGDRMGRVAAKRRVAIFGMRPRLAAAWIAVLTGVCIALATVGFIALISRDAREMLFHFDELKRDLTQLETEVSDLEYNRSVLAKDKQELEKHLASARTELEAKEEEASLLATRIEESNRRYDDIRTQLERAETELAEGEKRLVELHTELTEEEANNQLLREEQRVLQEQIDILGVVKSGLASEAKTLEERIKALREGNIAIEADQPLTYIPLSGGMTLPDSHKRIVSSLNELRLRLETDGITMKPVPASSLSDILNTLSLLTEDVILIVYSTSNVLTGETVEVTIELALDRIVFRKGELISRINIDADVGRDQLPELFAYVFTVVRAVALSQGMLPDIATGDVGSISSSDVAAVADEIEAVKGKRILEIRAGRDFRTTDILDAFEFVVKRD